MTDAVEDPDEGSQTIGVVDEATNEPREAKGKGPPQPWAVAASLTTPCGGSSRAALQARGAAGTAGLPA